MHKSKQGISEPTCKELHAGSKNSFQQVRRAVSLRCVRGLINSEEGRMVSRKDDPKAVTGRRSNGWGEEMELNLIGLGDGVKGRAFL